MATQAVEDCDTLLLDGFSFFQNGEPCRCVRHFVIEI